MNNYKKIIAIFMITILSACNDKAPSNNNASNSDEDKTIQSSKEFTSTSKSELDGYKELKFGMSSAQLAKLDNCNKSYFEFYAISNYPKLIENKKRQFIEYPFQDEIDRARKKVERLHIEEEGLQESSNSNNSTGFNTNMFEEYAKNRRETIKNDIAAAEAELKSFESKAENVRNNPDPVYQQEIQPLVEKLKLVESYDPSVTDKWAKSIPICHSSFRGQHAYVRPELTNGNVSKISISLGQFDNESFQSIVKALSDKYPTAYIPSDAQIAAFNSENINSIAYTFLGGQVAIAVYHGWQHTKTMSLHYFDPDSANEYLKTVTKGALLPGDI